MGEELLRVSNVQRFSVDDGPGIRTTVFLKGCNLRCAWCHNPENIEARFQLQWKEDLCLRCGHCAAACRRGVHRQIQGEKGEVIHAMDPSACKLCGECIKNCPGGALGIVGEMRNVHELLQLIRRDKDYYERSGGGVTFSGGEPLLQHRGLSKILERCRSGGIHTAVDTAGDVPYEWYQEILPYTDLFLYDLKCMTREIHTKYIGTDNARILDNIKRLSRCGARLIVRVPLIDPVNTEAEEIEKTADFLGKISNIEQCQLLPYHNYGVGKYGMLGWKDRQEHFCAPETEKMKTILDIFLANGVRAEIF